jgi:tetratricopeptide (TPR) repeat protein
MPRASLVVATVIVVCLAAVPARAQTARATGTVKDTAGKAMKGAIVRATNKDAYPSQITSTTDDKGRWAMIGLRTGTWTFVAEAPGYTKQEAQWPVRVAGTVPMHFVIARDLGPIPGALTKNIQQQLAAANALRDKGQLDQALVAYEQIRDQNPKLTAVNLVVGNVYRRKAALESDPAAKRALFDRAIASYTSMLNDDSASDRAKAEIESTRTEAAATR